RRDHRVQVGGLRYAIRPPRSRRSRGEDAGQGEGNAGTLPCRGEKIQRAAARQFDPDAYSSAAAERGGRPEGVHVFRRAPRHSERLRAEHLQRSYKITAEVTIPEGGAEGMIVTQGGRFAGYGFFLSKGEL